MHHIALNGAGPDDGDFDDKIVEASRAQARQHRHLRAALHLEHADTVCLAQHVIGGRVVRRDARQRVGEALMAFQQVKGLADTGQHAERQHIHLHDAERVDVVLVPFDEGAGFHGGIADRHSLGKRAARQHEAANML